MKLYFVNSSREHKFLSEPSTVAEINAAVVDYLRNFHYHCPYFHSWSDPEKYRVWFDVGSYTEFFYVECDSLEETERLFGQKFDFSYEESVVEPPAYRFPVEQNYRVTAVLDSDGNDVSDQQFFKDYVGCTINKLFYDEKPSYRNLYRLNIHFYREREGNLQDRQINTSEVTKVVETEEGVQIITQYSVYCLEKL